MAERVARVAGPRPRACYIYRMAGRSKLRKRWIVLSAFAVAILSVVAVVYLPVLPANAPVVLVSVDRTLWNRTGLNRLTHVRALRDAGLRPVLMDFEADNAESLSAADLLSDIDALVLGGGGDVDASMYGSDFSSTVGSNLQRDEFELALLQTAERLGLPVLGLCRGAQLINVYRGGTLGDFRIDTPRYRRHHRVLSGHAVRLDADSRLATIYGETELPNVVTFHGQYVDVPGRDVRVVGYAPDGTPEAIEVATDAEFGMLGVQWHAEAAPWDRQQARLFLALSDAAKEYRATRLDND